LIESTAVATHALELLEEGLHRLRIVPDVDIATALLETMGSLTCEYGPEFFTDDEITLISETTVVALAAVISHIEQENCE